MLSSTPSKGNRRSTRVGRYSRGSNGRTSRGGGDEGPSWQPSDKEARKWIQVMRPPAPNARFVVPTWVPIDELTPEEKRKYDPQEEETLAPSEIGDTEMTAKSTQQTETMAVSATAATSENSHTEMMAVDAEVSENAEKTIEIAATHPEAPTVVSETADALMETVDTKETASQQVERTTATKETASQQVGRITAKAEGADEFFGMATELATVETKEKPSEDQESPMTSAEAAGSGAAFKPTSLSPLSTSRETSQGIPTPNVDSKAQESIEPFEELRPHDPVADTLEEPETLPPSRPSSEPAALLMKGSAVPLIGDSVFSPVAVAAPLKDSTAAAPATAAADSIHFVHSDSDTTPFHTLAASASNEEKVAEQAQPWAAEPPSLGDDDDDEVSEPDYKRPKIE